VKVIGLASLDGWLGRIGLANLTTACSWWRKPVASIWPCLEKFPDKIQIPFYGEPSRGGKTGFLGIIGHLK
jgi:hypothetical protein